MPRPPLLSARLLVVHVLGLAAVLAALALAEWQHDAWQAGRELQVRDLTGTTPVPLDEALGPDAPFTNDQVGRPVEVAGAWLPGSTLEVADRTLDGRDGRWLVTPVAVCDRPASGCVDASAVLVVRGWLADGASRPPAPEGPVELTGWLQPGEGSGTPDPDPTDAVLPELRIASAVQRVDQDLYGGFVLARDLTGPGAAGLEPLTPAALPDAGSFTSLRNLLYALEWLVFAAFAAYIWFRWVRDDLARTEAAERAAGAQSDQGSDQGPDQGSDQVADPASGRGPVPPAGIPSSS